MNKADLINQKQFGKIMDTLTEKLKGYSLSNYDFLEIDPLVKITLSFDLRNMMFADELVNKQGIGIILWQYSKDVKSGHWISVIRQGDTFEVFDPYGFKFKDINRELNIKHGEDPNVLTNLIKQSGYRVRFNHKKLQGLDVDDNTCGRWVALRLAFPNYTIHEFYKLLNEFRLKYKIDPLELAVLTTLDKN